VGIAEIQSQSVKAPARGGGGGGGREHARTRVEGVFLGALAAHHVRIPDSAQITERAAPSPVHQDYQQDTPPLRNGAMRTLAPPPVAALGPGNRRKRTEKTTTTSTKSNSTSSTVPGLNMRPSFTGGGSN
jgi:hypothetical protein